MVSGKDKLNERLYAALQALMEYQQSSGSHIIKGSDTLGYDQTRTLVDAGYLQMVIKGWYIPSDPKSAGTSSPWLASYWSFLSAYMNDRFGSNWCLSAEQSLAIISGGRVIPTQIVVYSPSGSNNIIKLPFGCSILDMRKAIPQETDTEEEYGLRLYRVEDALLAVQPDYFQRYTLEATLCLAQIQGEDRFLQLALESSSGNVTRIGRVAGALRAMERESLADRIVRRMRTIGFNVNEENPFSEPMVFSRRVVSPYMSRMELLWSRMRGEILSSELHSVLSSGVQVIADSVLADMERNYVNDSYHSLSIEGYVVTRELLERVRSGRWDPKSNEKDRDERSALAARGYYQAYQRVKASIGDILNGADPAAVYSRDYRDWRCELFEPSVRAGIIERKDLFGFRNQQVYIRDSRHVPVGSHHVADCMEELDMLMRSEPDALVRGILGHFFFTWVHPYMDGNGRTARFVMNSQLSTGGFGWLVIEKEKRSEYMGALEEAALTGRIASFSEFIMGEIARKNRKVEAEVPESFRSRYDSALYGGAAGGSYYERVEGLLRAFSEECPSVESILQIYPQVGRYALPWSNMVELGMKGETLLDGVSVARFGGEYSPVPNVFSRASIGLCVKSGRVLCFDPWDGGRELGEIANVFSSGSMRIDRRELYYELASKAQGLSVSDAVKGKSKKP